MGFVTSLVSGACQGMVELLALHVILRAVRPQEELAMEELQESQVVSTPAASVAA